MVKGVYFTAAGIMALAAPVMGYAKGWLWGLAALGVAVSLVFIALSRGDDGSEGNGNARR